MYAYPPPLPSRGPLTVSYSTPRAPVPRCLSKSEYGILRLRDLRGKIWLFCSPLLLCLLDDTEKQKK